ncbi:25292_t:CDS:1, partial [Gigaspora margarita]
LMKYNSSSAYNRQGSIKTSQDRSSTQRFLERKILKKILEKLSNLEERQ